MYAAYGENGLLIYAEQVTQLSNGNTLQFFCPECRQRVYLKCSRRGKYYFAHKQACRSQPIRRDYAETQRHKQAKDVIVSACQHRGLQAFSEYYWEEIQQTADIYVPSARLVIEFQHSPISSSELRARTLNYRRLGLTVIWLMDAESFRSQFGTSWQQTMLQLNQYHELYWQMLDVQRERVIEWRQLAVLYRKNHRAHLSESLSLEEWVANHFRFPRRSQKVRVKRASATCYQRQLRQLLNAPTYRQSLQALYQAGTILQDVPEWVLCEQWHCLLTKSPGWLVLAWVYALWMKGESDDVLLQQLADVLEWVDLPFIDVNSCRWVAQAALNVYKEHESCTAEQNCVTLRKQIDK
ncbi:hypothetical protein NHG29_04425 [Aerococcaceae bacterium NML160702]|nr:hypothetical protein [Aerococcaceae bacterium NML160702]